MIAGWYTKTGKADEVLVVGEIEKPKPKCGELLIKIKYSGINPSDVKKREGVRGNLNYPLIIPHSDGSGIVKGVGEGVNPDRLNQRVWLWNAGWNRFHGTASEYITINSGQAIEMPENVKFSEAACIGIPIMTAHRCVTIGKSVKDKTILITGGAGVVGRYCIQIAKILGARVIVTVSNKKKFDIAKQAGADQIINYKEENVVEKVMRYTGDRGVDKIVDVDFGANLNTSSKIIKNNCDIVTYGSMSDPNPTIPFYSLMFKGVSVRTVIVYDLPNKVRRKAINDINLWLSKNFISHKINKIFELNKIAEAQKAVVEKNRIGSVLLKI